MRHVNAQRLTRSPSGSCLLRGHRREAPRSRHPSDDRLPGKDVSLIAEFIDASELGLALEQVADVLCEDELPLTPEERADMLALAERMQMGDRVERVLHFCPERWRLNCSAA